MGAGIAASLTPNSTAARLRSRETLAVRETVSRQGTLGSRWAKSPRAGCRAPGHKGVSTGRPLDERQPDVLRVAGLLVTADHRADDGLTMTPVAVGEALTIVCIWLARIVADWFGLVWIHLAAI